MKKSSRSGFTLIELVTVIGVLGVVGVISVSILTITLRGTKKADLLNYARQNGDVALTQMVKNIRYAASLDAPATCVPTTSSSSITITSLSDHKQTIYSCASNTISSNSASLIDTNSLQATSCTFTCAQSSTIVPPIITIQFTLSPKTAGSLAETTFSLPFQSSVTLRNY
ncbi:MAG TPA: prepilin-type N-terminal cleavage/methylation domain-containing protein [Candidatus Saccharimonadales bacterium]|nr:prepilin-type N-terminal cleavage/methylation domain-containing protein [Candidatus Saccharimonadales bacterium]